ncbi:MAG TPA: hypothetical protein VIF60_13610 [Burkholderiaceae bacterium]|jgi:hypothetical protein
MNKRAQKAALWSALVFPGAGHLFLKMYARGLVLFGSTVIAIVYIVHNLLSRGLVEQVNNLVYKALDGELSPDPDAIAKLLDLGPDPVTLDLASWLIVGCWIYGIVDSYRQGARMDRADIAQAK